MINVADLIFDAIKAEHNSQPNELKKIKENNSCYSQPGV
jgi:hypothetical protein